MLDSQWTHLKAASLSLDGRTSDLDAEHICLPGAIIDLVPVCGVKCIQEFVLDNYSFSRCSLTQSLSNLCTQKTSSGFTIGEGSLQCLMSSCASGEVTAAAQVYNICSSIPDAQPETVQTLTATVGTAKSVTSMSNAAPLPSSIGSPASTAEVTSIVMATFSPLVLPTTSNAVGYPQQSDSTHTNVATSNSASILFSGTSTFSGPTAGLNATLPTSTAGASTSRETPTKHAGLGLPQIVGIVVGCFVAVVTLLAILFICCRRRGGRSTPRGSKRFSSHFNQTPPPDNEALQEHPSQPQSADGALVFGSHSNHRYYASSPEEQKRRSFWRKSIPPEDIGVAVAPKALEDISSPVSVSSQQSMLHLLPKVPPKIPGQRLWPAPLNLQSFRQSKATQTRPISEATVFDEDVEGQPSGPRISAARDSFKLAVRSLSKRQMTNLAPLELNPISPDSSPTYDRKSAARIPLTPTYDNGNVGTFGSMPQGVFAGNSHSLWTLTRPTATEQLSVLPENARPTYPKRIDSLKPGSATISQSAARARKQKYPPTTKPLPHRKDSETTAATDIEDDATPEEQDSRLEAPKAITIPPPIFQGRDALDTEPRSPISNLRYPAVPRSAAVSSQAEIPASPRTIHQKSPSRSRPTRDVLVRNETSFMVSETTSSDGHLSEQSIQWPEPPPRGSSMKSNMLKLRENSAAGNKRSKRPGASLDQVLKSETKVQSTHISRPAQARVMPKPKNPSNKRDLFFTVEM